jgi:hypothetical protein
MDASDFLDEIFNASGVRIGNMSETTNVNTWVWKAEADNILEWRLRYVTSEVLVN